MVLIGEIALLLFVAYIVVCIVEIFTKKLVAYILVAFCLLVYAGVIMLFQQGQEKIECNTMYEEYKCK